MYRGGNAVPSRGQRDDIARHQRERARRHRERAAGLQQRMRHAPDVPELAEHAAAGVVHLERLVQDIRQLCASLPGMWAAVPFRTLR